jgi:hypothetical protein
VAAYLADDRPQAVGVEGPARTVHEGTDVVELGLGDMVTHEFLVH